jgi:hypothetical protein
MAVITNRYLRSNFYSTQTDNDGTVLTDPVTFKFNLFADFMRDKRAKVVTITSANEGSPELISYQHYGTHEFWWVIMFINRIQDPINELTPGTRIAIPFLSDIEAFRQSREAVSNRGESVILR